MAGGNMGDLFVSLGIKDEMSKTLEKIIKGMNGVDQATQDAKKRGEELLDSLNKINKNDFAKTFREANEYIEKNSKGIAGIVKSLGELGGKDLNALTGRFLNAGDLSKMASLLNAVSLKLREISRSEDDKAIDSQIRSWQKRVSNVLDYIKLLQEVNTLEKKVGDTKAQNPNVNTKSLDDAKKSVIGLREEIVKLLQSGGIDNSNILGGFTKLLGIAKTEVGNIISVFKKENPLSSFSNGAAKVEADITRVTEKLAKLRDMMLEGAHKGYKTSMLPDSFLELEKILSRLNAAKLNPSMLTDAVQMKALISDVSLEYLKATIAAEAYNREKRKITDANKEYAAAEKLSKKDHDAELKEMSDYIKRYMELLEAKRKADEKAEKEKQRLSEAEKRRIESDTARMSRLYASLGIGIGRGERAGMRGLEVGANTTALEKALSEATELKRKIEDANIALMGKGGRPAYEWYAAQVNTLKTNLANATQAQRDLNSAQDKANRQKDRKQAEELRKEAQAAKELKNEHKQLNRELEITRSRIQSTERALHNLREKSFTSKMLGLDTGEADAKIKHLETQLMSLRNIMLGLQVGDVSFLGRVGNLGNGREVQAANYLASSYDKANKEAQRGIEIEQKRQQEISKTAAKVQSELVRGFEKANRHAGALNSTVQDLKSLFLQGGLVFGAQQFAMSIITTGGEMEKQHIALQSILGDMQNANTMFNQIKELALNSPFTFSELNRDVKQLAAYGVEYENLYDTTKRLADMSSGLGVGFDRIALAFGQVQARGWLDGKELRQIAYAGIPLLDKLSKFYSQQEGRKVSTSEIKTRISNREVSFNDVKSIFWEMTNAGGQFYNMQQTLSETLLGRYNKLKDAWEIMLADFASGESLVGKFFKTAIEGVTTLVQSFHSLALPVGTIFAGYAMKKALSGNTASSFLANKANLAKDIQKRVMLGEQISSIEGRILATKNRITSTDLRQAVISGQLTKAELNRLMVSGQISAKQYEIYRALLLQQTATNGVVGRWAVFRRYLQMNGILGSLKNMWANFGASALASFRLIGTGIKALGSTIWSAIGGLPGIIVSSVTFGITYAISEYQELSQKIKQTQDEIADKNKQISEFLRDNNVSVAISGGDTKEIDNMIDSYKEKLKELAPYSYKNMLMSANEEADHKKRLQYLENEIKLLKEANDIASATLSNRGYYSDLKDVTEDVVDAFKNREKMRVAAMSTSASSGDKELYANERAYGNYIDKLKDSLAKRFGDIAKDEKLREAAMQAMSGIFSSMGVPEDKADVIRASVLQAFGCGDKSAWLQSEVTNSMISLIDKSFPMIGEKIKASIPLNDAEKAKVKELMDDAKKNLIYQYPELEKTLQNMLANSNFQAVIKLVFEGSEKLNKLQSTLVGRIPKQYQGYVMGETGEKYKTYAEKWGKEDSWYSARNAAQADIDNALNEYESARNSNAKDASDIYSAYKLTVNAAKDLLNYDYKGKGKKSNKAGKTNTKDTELESLKRKIDLYKKFYSELEKYRNLYGRQGAFAQIKSEKEFQPIFKMGLSDPGTYGVSIGELLNRIKSNTEERADYKKSQIADIHAKNRSDEEARIKAQNSELSKQLDILTEQYDTYKKLYELTGDSRGASMVAFGHVQNGTIKDELKSQMSVAIQQHNNRAGTKYTADDVLNMTEADFNSKIGKDSENVSVIYERWRNEVAKIKKESIDLMAELIQKNATIEQQIEDENRAYERQKKLIEESDTTSEMKQRALKGLDKNHNEAIGKLKFEQFKEQSDWVTIFDDLDRVSTNTINSMITGIEDFSKTTGLSVEVVKQLRKALDNLRKESIDRNPFGALFNSTKRGNAIGSYLKGNLGDQYKNGDSYILTKEQAKKMGLQAGKKYTKADLENEQQGAYDDFQSGLTSLANKMKSLQDCLNPVIDLFAALGKEDTFLGQATSTASSALGAASQVSGGLKDLGLGKLGPYGAAAGAVLSIITSLSAMHDKTLQKEIEASEARQKELDNMVKNIKTIIEDTLGGIYSYEVSKDTKDQLKKVTDNYDLIQKVNNSKLAKENPLFKMKGTYSEETYKAAKEAQAKPDSAYHAELASLMAQRDEIQNQRDAENKKKKKDSTKIADYNQQIKEMDQSIKTFAQDFLKEVYSIDFKTWASELTDTIVSAWSKGEDAVEAYRDKVKDLMKDVVKNVISQKIIEAYMEKPLGMLTKTLEEKGKLDEGDIANLAKELYDSAEGATSTTTQILDYLKNKGLDLTENGTSSARNSVKSITEETADILCSYVNAIRLDVSVMRTEQAKFYPEMSVIAKSQLTQLNTIAQNTLRNADAAERIERMFIEYNDNFNKVLNGTKSLKIK
nr:MAG TPA: tail tape measure protein [Caudoviricetes sp.]